MQFDYQNEPMNQAEKEVFLPQSELSRLLKLSSLDLDYTSLQDKLKDLVLLAAKIGGTDISLVNLIDNYTQWSVSSHGLAIDQMPRTDSVCQHTINGNRELEISDLKSDSRFKDKFYVAGSLDLRYYFGVPLTTNDGFNLGALCLLDKKTHSLEPERIEMLKIVANEIVTRLQLLHHINSISNNLDEANQSVLKAHHDIRGPVNGILGLTKCILDTSESSSPEETLEFVTLIHQCGQSLLTLIDDILTAEKFKKPN